MDEKTRSQFTKIKEAIDKLTPEERAANIEKFHKLIEKHKANSIANSTDRKALFEQRFAQRIERSKKNQINYKELLKHRANEIKENKEDKENLEEK